MKELLGEGHHGVVSLLLDRVDQVASGNRQIAPMVILEGASGVGKTHVVRELYRQLREIKGGGYWPHLPEADRADPHSRDPLPGRKSTGPGVEDFKWPARTLPTFGWWQLHCERMQAGGAMDVAAQARPNLKAHLVPMTLAWSEAASPKEKFLAQRDELIDRAREALADKGLEIAAEILREFGIVIPCLYTAVSWLFKGVNTATSLWQLHQDVAHDVNLGHRVTEERHSAGAELADLILDTTHNDLPGIVVIEDIHLMDAALSQLLDRLLEPTRAGQAVTIVAMAWPEGRNHGAYADWITGVIDTGRVEIVPMPELAVEDLREIILSYAPETPHNFADEVARRYANPLAIEATLSSRLIKRAIEDNGQSLPTQALDTYPTGIDDIYRERFRQLDNSVQNALAIAAGCLPDPTSTLLHTFLREMVAKAVLANPRSAPDVSVFLAGIQTAADDRIWLLTDNIGERFKEPRQPRIAYEFLGENLLLKEEKEALLNSMQCALSDWIDAARDDLLLPDDEESALVSKWLLGLSRSADTTEPSQSSTLLTAAYCKARAYTTTYQYKEAADCVEPYLNSDVAEIRQLLDIRFDAARWRGESGRVDQAVGAFRRLVTDAAQALDADDPFILNARHELAHWLAEMGRIEEATVEHQSLLEDRKRILGFDHRDTLRTRYYVARLHGSSGRPGIAVEQLREVLFDSERKVGKDDPLTLAIRAKLARWMAENGEIEQAIKDLQELLADTAAARGDYHPHTLATRHALGDWQGVAGNLDDAISTLTQVLTDRTNTLGPDNPFTLSTRNELAVVIGEAGDLDRAIAHLRQVLDDRERILGPQHRRTFKTRFNLAEMLAMEGKIELALTEMRSILKDRERSLGPEHPDTLQTRKAIKSLEASANSGEPVKFDHGRRRKRGQR